MASAYLAADLVIGRAGATTVAELALAAKPAVLVPYPSSRPTITRKGNAREMAEAGGALMLRQAELTAASLADALRPIVAEPARRAAMATAMRAFGRPRAAADIVDWCQAQAGRRPAW